MSADRVVVIGDPTSVFVQAPVRHWRSLGIDARIVTARWSGGPTVADGLPVVDAVSATPTAVRRLIRHLEPFLGAVDAMAQTQDPARARAALATWGPHAEPPSLVPPLQDALHIAAAVGDLGAVAVLGQEAFAYGLATAWSPAPRRALVVWGADVLHYAGTSDLAHALVREALHGVHYVLTNATPMADALQHRFDVPTDRIASMAWGVGRRLFHRASPQDSARLRARHGIAPEARILMNLRRFLPHWGAETAWASMLDVAAAESDVHLVLLDGAPVNPALTRAIDEASARGLAARLTTPTGTASLETVAELMSIADVALSLVDTLEPVSWSVLQAAACGCALVVADQRTYRDEADRGLALELVPPADPAATTAAIRRLLSESSARGNAADRNDRFVRVHHDETAHMARLLRLTAGRAVADRLLGCPAQV